jgi:rsbT antagonist protein RsbS
MNIVDAFLGRFLNRLVSTARIMNADAVIVGMQPAVAMTLVELGITLPDLATTLNIDLGVELLRKRLGLVSKDDSKKEPEDRSIDHIEGNRPG